MLMRTAGSHKGVSRRVLFLRKPFEKPCHPLPQTLPVEGRGEQEPERVPQTSGGCPHLPPLIQEPQSQFLGGSDRASFLQRPPQEPTGLPVVMFLGRNTEILAAGSEGAGRCTVGGGEMGRPRLRYAQGSRNLGLQPLCAGSQDKHAGHSQGRTDKALTPAATDIHPHPSQWYTGKLSRGKAWMCPRYFHNFKEDSLPPSHCLAQLPRFRSEPCKGMCVTKREKWSFRAILRCQRPVLLKGRC